MGRTLVWSLCLGAFVAAGGIFAVSRSAAFEPSNPALKLSVEGRTDALKLATDTQPGAPAQRAFPKAFAGGYQLAPSITTPAPTALADVQPEPFLTPADADARGRDVQVEYTLSAPSTATGLGVDLSVVPRAGLTVGPEGSQVRSVGGEVRLGKRLEGLVSRFDGSQATLDRPSWYFFAATDGTALTWTPEAMAAGARRGIHYQDDRIVVGKAQVGLTLEARRVQASIGFTNREVSNGKESVDENFVGASFAMRR